MRPSPAPERVLVAPSSFAEFDPTPLQRLQDAGFEAGMNDTGRRLNAQEVVERAQGCVGIIAGLEPLGPGVLEQLPALRCISRCGVGIDNVDMELAASLGIAVRTTPEAPTVAVAELTVLFILSLLRSLPQTSQAFHAGAWARQIGSLLQGRTVGLIGFGRIGREVAARLRPFGCNLLTADPALSVPTAAQAGARLVSIDELLVMSEIVSLHVSMSAGAPPILGRREIERIRPGAWIVNVARGSALDEAALIDALQSGRLAGAALDVFAEEPYQGPLRGMNQVIAMPHVGSYTRETRLRMELEAVDNLVAALSPNAG